MRLNVSAWSIRKPIPSVVLFIVLIVLGVFSFRQLPITRFPTAPSPWIFHNSTDCSGNFERWRFPSEGR